MLATQPQQGPDQKLVQRIQHWSNRLDQLIETNAPMPVVESVALVLVRLRAAAKNSYAKG